MKKYLVVAGAATAVAGAALLLSALNETDTVVFCEPSDGECDDCVCGGDPVADI